MSDSIRTSDRSRVGIDKISTRWPLIKDPVLFVMRYAPAIRGYLEVFLKTPHDVEDVCQTFLLRVIERGVVEEKVLNGRFRDYLIATVRNAALAHLRRRSAAILASDRLAEIPVDESVTFPGDEEWIARWRRIILANAWELLENYQRERPGNLAYTVLRALVDHPNEDSAQHAARVSNQCGRTLQPEAFRKQVSRARRLFAGFLVAEVARSLDDATPLRVEEELIDIDLMKYVHAFLPDDWRTNGKLVEFD